MQFSLLLELRALVEKSMHPPEEQKIPFTEQDLADLGLSWVSQYQPDPAALKVDTTDSVLQSILLTLTIDPSRKAALELIAAYQLRGVLQPGFQAQLNRLLGPVLSASSSVS